MSSRRALLPRALLLVLAALPARAAPPAGWRLVLLQALEQQATYAGFLDERSGITVGLHGLVHYTADGGETWPEARNASDCRSTLELLPDGFAWHAGTVEVNRSFDGGRTWYRGASFQRDGVEYARALSFADWTRGWVATSRGLWATEDGGLHWRALALPPEVLEVASVSLAVRPPDPGAHDPALVALNTVPRVTGRVLDAAGRLWVTEDGGASWSRAESPLQGKAFLVAARAPTAVLRFTAAGEGALAAFVKVAGGWRCRVFRTASGGAWAEEALPPLGEPGTLFLSPDGRLLTWRSFDRNELRLYARGEARAP